MVLNTYWKIQEGRSLGIPSVDDASITSWFDVGISRFDSITGANKRIRELCGMPMEALVEYGLVGFRPVQVTEKAGRMIKVNKK